MSDEDQLQTIALRSDFYRDGFYSLLYALFAVLIGVVLMVGILIWLIVSKPSPVTFSTGSNWRVFPLMPVNQPWIATPDLIQWITDVVPSVLTIDFVNYTEEMQFAAKNFTQDGYKKYQQFLNQYASQSTLQSGKWFVNASAAGAPFILNQGLLQGHYSWWIQIPVNLSYSSAEKGSTVPLVLQVLVTRVETTDDLKGIRIANMIVTRGVGEQVLANG